LKTENKRHKLRERLDAKTIFFNSTFLTKLEETLNRDVLSLSGLDGNFDKDLMYLLILGVLLYIFVCHFPIKEKTTVKIWSKNKQSCCIKNLRNTTKYVEEITFCDQEKRIDGQD
jgi:hypothetical protein